MVVGGVLVNMADGVERDLAAEVVGELKAEGDILATGTVASDGPEAASVEVDALFCCAVLLWPAGLSPSLVISFSLPSQGVAFAISPGLLRPPASLPMCCFL